MSPVTIWIWFCAYLNCAGWALSAIHQLNPAGYAITLTIWFLALIIWRKTECAQILPVIPWRKLGQRFRKPFPLAFLVLAAMAFLGGTIYTPNNYDALAYRIPRVLHWLAAHEWHWIHTSFPRVNTRACGVEWVSAPVISLLKTDRPLFLINIISFLLLPSLVFSVFTKLGVRARVAWHWMWVVPSGYCFLLQAGSISNDLFGAVFALAAIAFALRAKGSMLLGDFSTSILAAALLSGSKTSNLPLLLPWALAIFPSIRLALNSFLRTVLICIIAFLASLAPTAVLNAKFSGDWTGMRAEHNASNAPVTKLCANIVLITAGNLVPPIFPQANKWNSTMEKILPPRLKDRFGEVMEHPGDKFHLGEMQTEENAGLGLGVCALLLASTAAISFQARKKNTLEPRRLTWVTCVRWSPMISLVVLMTQSNLVAIARLLTPYYALLLPPFLASTGQEGLVKKRLWRMMTLAVFCLAAVPLIVAPARPLFPVMTILARTPTALARLREVYTVYHNRNDAFAAVREALQPNLNVLGCISSDDPETSLWRPFGTRRIIYVCPGDTATDLKSHRIKYILVRSDEFGNSFPGTLDDWLANMNAQTIQTIPLDLRASVGAKDWYLVKLN